MQKSANEGRIQAQVRLVPKSTKDTAQTSRRFLSLSRWCRCMPMLLPQVYEHAKQMEMITGCMKRPLS